MRSILCLLALMLLPCCASTSVQVEDGTPIEVHYYGQEHLSIVNDSWLVGQGIEGSDADERRNNFTSDISGDPLLKVLGDDAMIGLLQALDQSGLRAPMSQSGPAPRGGSFGMALEVREGSAARHAVSHAAMPAEQRIQLLECVKVFNAVYNAILHYQAVPEDVGREMLEEAQAAGASR